MKLNSFQAFKTACELSDYANGRAKLIGVYTSSSIKLYPFQMAAALFALRSPYLKGVVLCDEGGLGKTVEALLVVAQKWCEGERRLLIISPNHLLKQWEDMIEEKFDFPWLTICEKDKLAALSTQGNLFFQDAVILTSYDFAVENCEMIREISWDAVVFEEASRLSKIHTGMSGEAEALKSAAGNAFKILVTPTPIEMSIMDVYGLIYFIDKDALPEKEWFYKRYFRKSENYGELAENISRYCFRTLRSQAKRYMKLTERIPVSITYRLTKSESELYALLEDYLKKPEKKAFPQMDNYELTIMLTKIASSSSFALQKTLGNIERRLESYDESDEELSQIRLIKEAAENVRENAKGKLLLFLLKKLFPLIKKNGGRKKALIFTENRITQEYLKRLLSEKGYSSLVYNGAKSKDYEILEEFEKSAEILICTEVASSGLNLQICSLVINYDWSYNAMEMEQRINRCHRQDQENDVIVINLVNPENFADVRMLELMKKRILQFDGIVGMSDEIAGEFFDSGEMAVEYISKKLRPVGKIEEEHKLILRETMEENIREAEEMENRLFTTFDGKIAENVEIKPQYIEEKIQEINDKLWDLIKYFFEHNSNFSLIEETRTVKAARFNPPSPFIGVYNLRESYSMLDRSVPRAGRITVTGKFAGHVLEGIFWKGISQRGKVVVDSDIEKCVIGFYEISVYGKYVSEWKEHTFVGICGSGKLLTDEECRKIMELPALHCMEIGKKHLGQHDFALLEERVTEEHPLDKFVSPEDCLNRAVKNLSRENAAAIEEEEISAENKKAALDREIEKIKLEIKAAEKTAANTAVEKVVLKKKINMLTKELKQKQQSFFMEEMRIDAHKEEKIREIIERTKLYAKVKRLFLLDVEGKQAEEL
ncbi:DEAD/DEAH box helicase [Anaerotignum faecicola]|nr:DEAD/DEAH box helicase [Anaerotignum faecicola]